MIEYEWRAADSEFTPVQDEADLITRLQKYGGKGRSRVVDEWQDYTLPVEPAEVVAKLKAYFEHNPSSTFPAAEVLEVIEGIERGRCRGC